VRGTLTETPGQRVYVRDEMESWRTLARLEVTALARGAIGSRPAAKSSSPRRENCPRNFFKASSRDRRHHRPPALPVAEGLFDYRAFLQRQGIHFQLKSGSTNDWQRLSADTRLPWSDRFLAWSQTTLARGCRKWTSR